MPKIIGSKTRVVDTGSFAIDEWAGNVGTKDDTLSIATVVVNEPTQEPWLTLHYDEWLCVTTGRIELEYYDGDEELKVLVVHAGQTAMVSKGERFRPVFPIGNTTYIPVCLPAFSPDRCIREEEDASLSDVSKKLQELHGGDSRVKPLPSEPVVNKEEEEVLYHMCQSDLWETAVRRGVAYFPPTFVADERFTHATAVPSRLITTANHFYTKSVGNWICLQLSRSALFKLGIETVFEEAKPVGSTNTNKDWDGKWICPHIFGGIPTHIPGVVTKIFQMQRNDDGSFASIVGLVG